MEGSCFYQPGTPEDGLKTCSRDVRVATGTCANSQPTKNTIFICFPQLPLVTLAAAEKHQKYSPIRGLQGESEF